MTENKRRNKGKSEQKEVKQLKKKRRTYPKTQERKRHNFLNYHTLISHKKRKTKVIEEKENLASQKDK